MSASKSISLLYMICGLWACAEPAQTVPGAIVIEKNLEADKEPEPLPDFSDPTAPYTALTALPDPKVDEQFYTRGFEGSPQLYLYLLTHFDTLGPKSIFQMDGGRICEFEQEFEAGISFFADACHAGNSRNFIYFPGAAPDDVIDLYAKLNLVFGDTAVRLPEFEWVSDSSYFSAATDSSQTTKREVKVVPDSSGCSLRIFTND